MKKTKIIIPALGILLLSTAASVTGTVAWFSANSTVEATGMTVKALSSNLFLQISNANNASSNDAKTSAAAVTTAKEVSPVDYMAISTTDGSVTWGKTISEDPDDPNYTARASLEAISTGINNYVWSDSFNFWIVASNGQTGSNLKLTDVTVTYPKETEDANGNGQLDEIVSDLAPALRVLVVCDDGAMLWHPAGASENKTALSTTTLIDVINYKDSDPAPTGILKTVPNGQEARKTAQVYVYYCGNDDCVTTNHAQLLDNITVSLSFGVDQ